jgi:hypothetical protein
MRSGDHAVERRGNPAENRPAPEQSGVLQAPLPEPRGTQFTCFTGTKVQILTPEELCKDAHSCVHECTEALGLRSNNSRALLRRAEAHLVLGDLERYSVYLPYWYKSNRFTSTKVLARAPQTRRVAHLSAGTWSGPQCTYFTGTKVQILAQKALPARR